MNWLNLPKYKQQELFKQLSAKTGIQPQAIEKDAWVTLVLRSIFNSQNRLKRFVTTECQDIDMTLGK